MIDLKKPMKTFLMPVVTFGDNGVPVKLRFYALEIPPLGIFNVQTQLMLYEYALNTLALYETQHIQFEILKETT